MTFLEKHPEFHVLLHELVLLHKHNKGTVLGVEQLLFAEGALVRSADTEALLSGGIFESSSRHLSCF